MVNINEKILVLDFGAGIYLKARSTIVKKRRESIEIQK